MQPILLFIMIGVALPAVASASSAQAPLMLSSGVAAPYTIIDFNFSEHAVSLAEGSYFFVYRNDGDLPAEYWIRNASGETVDHATFCCDGGTAFHAKDSGRYLFQIHGEGQFALTRHEPLDNLHIPAETYHFSAVDTRMAVSISKDAPGAHVCVTARAPYSWEATAAGLEPLASGEAPNGSLHYSFEPDGYFQNLFLEGGTEYTVVISVADCSMAAVHAPPVVATPGLVPAVVLATLGLLAARRR